MANKTYYEQNYPTTKYEYCSKGYRNERMHSGDSRKIKMHCCDPVPVNPDYCYYKNFSDEEGCEKDGEDHWSESADCCVEKQNSVAHETSKRSPNSQPFVNTPRYYRNMVHRRPSALCMPLLAQSGSTVRRKSKSQSRVDGGEREQKSVRYRVKQPRHHLLPPPPSLPQHAVPITEQTDLETSSGDGRRSLQSQTQSSGSLSVDISSQVETLNQSFNAVTKERRGKKIIYGDVEPVYTNVENTYNNMKSKKSHRRHSRRHKHSEPLENWATELWDLPEENQNQDWLDRAETDWTNLERQNSCSFGANTIDPTHRKPRSKKNHQEQTQHHDCQLQQQMQPQHPHLVPSKLLNPNLARPRTQGSHESSKDSQDTQVIEVSKTTETAASNSEDKTEKISFLENLFSEVFAQGCVDKLSKRTRLDFLKEAYDKYSASVEDTEKLINSGSKEHGSVRHLESKIPNQSQNNYNQWTDNYIDQSEVENRQISQFALSFERVNSKSDNNKVNSNVLPDDLCKTNKTLNVNNNNNNETRPNGNDIMQKGVTNFLLSVKPRRRSMKINETEIKEKQNASGVPKFTDQEKDSIPRFPNLIENMSTRYTSSSNLKNTQLGHLENMSNHCNTKNHSDVSNSNSSSIQKQSSKECAYQMSGNSLNTQCRSLKESDLNSDQQSCSRSGTDYNNQTVISGCQFSMDAMNRNCGSSYGKEHDSSPSQPCNLNLVHRSISSNSGYSEKDCSKKQGDTYNYPNIENINKADINNSYENKEDYSFSMESNYLTIKKCQEILNQVKENFGEHVKKNPDVFHSDAQYETVVNDQGTYCAGGTVHHGNSHSFNESAINDCNQPNSRDCVSPGMENQMAFSYPNNYENIHCHGDNSQNYSKTDSYQLQESMKNLGNEKIERRDAQTYCYLQEERQNSQNWGNYFETTQNSTARNNESNVSKEHSTGNHEISHYDAIDQDKIKQFIHSLTGFDAVKQREANGRRDEMKCAEQYENNHPKKHHFDHCNSQETYASAGFPNSPASDNHYVVQQNPHRQISQSSQQQQLQQHPKPRGVELANFEKRQQYSLPQRKEIEKMQQDSVNIAKVSCCAVKEESQMTYQDIPSDVPDGSPSTSQDVSCIGTSETKDSEHFKLRKAQNQMNFMNNENYKISNSKKRENMYVDSEHNPTGFSYESNYSTVCEQVQNVNFHQNQDYYFGNTASGAIGNVACQDYAHKIIQSNCVMNSNESSSERGFNNMTCHQHFSNHAHHYNTADVHNDQYPDNKSDINDVNSSLSAGNREGDFATYNEPSTFENGCPVDNSEDSDAAVMKRKYYFMPSEHYNGNVEKFEERSMSDQSLYKSYIENLIDNSLPPPGNETSLAPRKQGQVLQSQNDVVELETDKAIDLVMNESSCQVDSKLCLEITQRLTDTLVQSHKDIPTPCLVALEEPVYLQQLKKLRWDHLRHIEREVKRLESLERFLDTCGCGHMMYTKSSG